MQDLSIISLFLTSCIASLLICLAFIIRLRLKKYRKEAEIKSLALIQNKDLPLFYSSQDIKQAATRKFFRLPPLKQNALARAALKNPAKAFSLIKQQLKKNPKNPRLLLLFAEISLLLNNRIACKNALEKAALPRFAPPQLKASFFRLAALNELYLTDMQNASLNASRALKICQKHNFYFEEGECYLALMQIYRISCCFDIAHTMLKEAEKIFARLKIPAKIAETSFYFGLIELGQENYDNALSHFKNAKKISKKHNLTRTLAAINNWEGLAYYIKNDLKTAHARFTDTKKLNPLEETAAFASEMSARIFLKRKAYGKALNDADTALKIWQKKRHLPGIFENLYLKAEIFYAKENYHKSQAILTRLIKAKTPHNSLYYPANAYTLLGLINLKNNNLSLAKTLFKQALDLENSRNRPRGAAIDLANLAELACRQGYKEEAETYLEKALSIAEELNDANLLNILKKR